MNTQLHTAQTVSLSLPMCVFRHNRKSICWRHQRRVNLGCAVKHKSKHPHLSPPSSQLCCSKQTKIFSKHISRLESHLLTTCIGPSGRDWGPLLIINLSYKMKTFGPISLVAFLRSPVAFLTAASLTLWGKEENSWGQEILRRPDCSISLSLQRGFCGLRTPHLQRL